MSSPLYSGGDLVRVPEWRKKSDLVGIFVAVVNADATSWWPVLFFSSGQREF